MGDLAAAMRLQSAGIRERPWSRHSASGSTGPLHRVSPDTEGVRRAEVAAKAGLPCGPILAASGTCNGVSAGQPPIGSRFCVARRGASRTIRRCSTPLLMKPPNGTPQRRGKGIEDWHGPEMRHGGTSFPGVPMRPPIADISPGRHPNAVPWGTEGTSSAIHRCRPPARSADGSRCPAMSHMILSPSWCGGRRAEWSRNTWFTLCRPMPGNPERPDGLKPGRITGFADRSSPRT